MFQSSKKLKRIIKILTTQLQLNRTIICEIHTCKFVDECSLFPKNFIHQLTSTCVTSLNNITMNKSIYTSRDELKLFYQLKLIAEKDKFQIIPAEHIFNAFFDFPRTFPNCHQRLISFPTFHELDYLFSLVICLPRHFNTGAF